MRDLIFKKKKIKFDYTKNRMDAEQKPLSMTKKEKEKIKMKNNKAFTLIELLVVVLIIGILAAIAVPQYQKAVEKSRIAEAYTATKAIQEAMDLYFLTNGTGQVNLFDPETSHLTLSFKCPIVSDGTGDPFCATENFLYEAYCGKSNNCYINAFRYKKADYTDLREHYAFSRNYNSAEGWYTRCYYHSDFGEKICKSLDDIKYLQYF